MSKGQDIFRKMIEEAKSHWRWEAAVAGNNIQWNIYQLRKRKGWSQHELARRMGVAQPWVARHMAGYQPSLDSLAKYAHVFGVTIADIVGEPMHFEPHAIFDDEGNKVGEYSTSADTATITRKVAWRW